MLGLTAVIGSTLICPRSRTATARATRPSSGGSTASSSPLGSMSI